MKQHYPNIGLEKLCGLFGKSRQAFYDQSQRTEDRQLEEAFILDMVREIRTLMPAIGALKLHFMLKEPMATHHISIGRDRFRALLRDYNLLVKTKKRARVRTTDSNHPYHKWPDLTPGLQLTTKEQLWVSDITYLQTEDGFVYLSLITDAWSHKIVGYHLSLGLRARGPLSALAKAIRTRTKPAGALIHHSDRGIQYCCTSYVTLLQSNGISVSMTQSGSPYENALAERVNGILKGELGLGGVFKDYRAALKATASAIDTYNRIRPHMSCGNLTPNQAHLFIDPLNNLWKKQKKLAVKPDQY